MRVWITVGVLLAASRPAAAQQPEAVTVPPAAVAQQPAAAAQPPVFGVGVDVVAVDASVVDADGRPILGLGPEDFRVEVDGKPRRIVTVDYLGRDLEPPASGRAAPPTSAATRMRRGVGSCSCSWTGGASVGEADARP